MTQSSEDDRILEGIRRKGWRQGSIITVGGDQLIPLAAKDLNWEGNTSWVLLSHDCDIVHRDFENELHVEVMAAKCVGSSDGNLLHGKNPRRIQLKMGEKWIEFHVGTRRFTERRNLANLVPDGNLVLPRESVQSLVGWLARRYVRTAFPDSFNNRLQSQEKEIKKLMSNEGGNICTVYVLFADKKELPVEQVYKIEIAAVMSDEDFDIPAKRTAVEKTLGKLVDLFRKCVGITVDQHSTRGERDISLTDLRSLQRLEFDHLSHGENKRPGSPRF